MSEFLTITGAVVIAVSVAVSLSVLKKKLLKIAAQSRDKNLIE